MLTFGYWTRADAKKEFGTAAEAERAARRYAKRENSKVELWGWLQGGHDSIGHERIGYVWPSGQVDLTFEGSHFL